MNRKKMFNKLPHSLITADLDQDNEEYSWSTLTMSEERKCRQRF